MDFAAVVPTILHLDNHLLVIDKPAGLLSQGDATGDATVLTWGKAYLKEAFAKPGNVFLALVHRLDRPASGVMVLARTSKAAGRLAEQFRRRTPEKRYLAVVEGEMSGAGRCEDVLLKAQQHVRVVPPGTPQGKPARLTWNARAHRAGVSLVEVALETGRAHQIRVQLAHRGHPILGDLRYGARRELDGRNLALHAFRLTFDHPTQRTPMTFTTPPPWAGLFAPEIEALVRREAG